MSLRLMPRTLQGILRHMLAFALLSLTLPLAAQSQQTTPQTDNPMRIATIGAGNIGGTVGALLARAGHHVFFSSRHPEELEDLVERIGPNAHAGTVAEAIEYADVIMLAMPYAAMPQIGKEYGDKLAGKVILDAANPHTGREGALAEAALAKGAGVATAGYLPGARIVRAFNCTNYRVFASESHRAGEKLGVPLAGDDAVALAVAVQLVRDAGFEPVIAGGLETSKQFDRGSDLFIHELSASGLRKALNLAPN